MNSTLRNSQRANALSPLADGQECLSSIALPVAPSARQPPWARLKHSPCNNCRDSRFDRQTTFIGHKRQRDLHSGRTTTGSMAKKSTTKTSGSTLSKSSDKQAEITNPKRQPGRTSVESANAETPVGGDSSETLPQTRGRKSGATSRRASDERNFISIRGAREHNLQDVSLRLPKNKLIVMSGVSGSGKSSLAFDTLYAEGQRRYVESLSSYARQFLGQMPKPEVDSITGLAPSISIQQKTSGRNPRSTVGTITEVYDYLRVLFARVGKQLCPQCSRAITAQSAEHIIDTISLLPDGEKFSILAPLIEGQKGEYRDLFDDLLKQGFVRARVDGRVVSLSDDIRLDKQMRHTIEVVIDRLVAGKTPRARLAEAVEIALKQANGKLIVARESESSAPQANGTAETNGTNENGTDESDESDDPLRPSGPVSPTESRAGDRLFSSDYACTHCGLSFDPPSPQLFSFNSPQGMCKDCNGLGDRFEFMQEQLIEDPTKSIWKGALALVGQVEKVGRWKKHVYVGAAAAIDEDLGLSAGTTLKTNWDELPEEAQRKFLYGLGDRHVTFEMRYSGGVWKHGGTFKGVVNELLEEYRKAKNPMRRKQIEKFMRFNRCSTCNGSRLNRQAASVVVTSLAAANGINGTGTKGTTGTNENGTNAKPIRRSRPIRPTAANNDVVVANALSLSLPQVCALDVESAWRFFEKLELSDTEQLIAVEVLKEIRGRLGFLLRCGLNYLTLDRTAPTLSGGESQRIRLAGQIGCGLCDVVYILDEPSIGLHPRDNTMLLGSLQDLRDQGNTVIVVEHDDETMLAADHIVDFGPGPGVRGGEVVAEGSVDDIKKSKRSVTGAFLSKRREIAVPAVRRKLRMAPPADAFNRDPLGSASAGADSPRGKRAPQRGAVKRAAAVTEVPQQPAVISIRNAQHHNLKGIDVDIPLGLFVCVTGVSGSGKSSLVNDILWEVLNRDLNKGDGKPGEHESLVGLDQLDKAIDIDQSPIGRTPRSNPATYVKLADLIRDLYTQLPEAKRRGFKPGRFSFNVSGGRCEACEGHGANKLEMDFLADIWVTCPVCGGKRFNHETLEVRFKGKNIAEVLEMDVQEGLEHFENVPKIKNMLQTLHDVGLDYLKLGQPSPTLSGGEAQRIKLARELGKRSTGKTIYILDEPTTGLHFADIEKLLEVLHGFVDAGNTVLVVEHNLDVIKTADWIIDIGPEGGSGGGTVVCCGTPEEVARCERSHTGRALRAVLGLRVDERGSGGEGEKGRKVDSRSLSLAPPLPLSPSPPLRAITIRGAAQHNLQHIDLTIPREQMNVFCGPSGSGKTSLAMDTLYAEGQRRYVESLSAYARQFLGQMPKPKVAHIHGLQPAIAIEQKTVGSTPRSTIGTVTEIYDYLRILWCRLGTLHCPDCKLPVNTQTTDQVVGKLLTFPEGAKFLLLAPQEVKVGQHYEKLWQTLTEQGYARVRVDGTTYRLDEVPDIDRKSKHNVEVVVDRITIKREQRTRLAESIEAALDLGKGLMRVAHVDEARAEPDWKVDPFSLHRACETCGRSFEELTPNNFSFNSPLGWCSSCEGLGTQRGTDLRVLIGDPNRSLRDAAVSAWPDPRSTPFFAAMLESMARELGWDLNAPFSQLDPAQRRQVLYGTGEKWFHLDCGDSSPLSLSGQPSPAKSTVTKKEGRSAKRESGDESPHSKFQYKGLFPAVEEAARVSYQYRQRLFELVGEVPCSTCDGSRLRDDSAAVRFGGKTLQQISELPLGQAYEFLEAISLSGSDAKVAGDLLIEAKSRMKFLIDVGLEYLTLSRSLPTLSGGESQRIRLAGQIGRALTGVLYVLDEPTIGLHPRDNARLLQALKKLKELGNTLVLVEHDKEVIAAADRIYDFGPGAGRFGGTVVDEGSPKDVSKRAKGLTGQYLGKKCEIVVPLTRRVVMADADAHPIRPLNEVGPMGRMGSDFVGPALELLGARLNNLRDVNLRIPLGSFCCITGVSGSGKSSLIEHTLAKALLKHLHRSTEQPGPYDKLVGLNLVDKAIVVDQQPIGFTPKSNPGTYTGVFDHIRELFARLPDSKVRGYAAGRFSFNRAGGRCEACEGDGQKKIEMHFLPDVWVQCEECRGQRYNKETLGVRYKGKSISDVLDMSIGQCLELFENIPAIRKMLATLCAIGLDYLTLGQSATTLSGGEAQRVKLATELARPSTGKTIYILDEPTTGLHFDDIDKLLKVLNSLVELGNTVVVVEHNLDVIKTADWIIDLGPEAGQGGGWIVAEGTPEDVVRRFAMRGPALQARQGGELRSRGVEERKTAGGSSSSTPSLLNSSPPHLSHTAEQLAPVLAASTRAEREIFNAADVGKKRSGDLSLSEVGKDSKMPWEVDGRKWHTQERLAHNGKRVRWEGEVLARVIETIEELGEAPVAVVAPKDEGTEGTKATKGKKRASKAALAGKLMSGADLLRAQQGTDSEALPTPHSSTPQLPTPLLRTIWNDPSTVEVLGDAARYGWFMHALTRDEWLLKLKFRVEKNRFEERELQEKLGLKDVNDVKEIQVYNRSDRVTVKNQRGAFQEVTITVHWLREIDTPEFWEFLQEARESYMQLVTQASTEPEDVTPWKVLGKKWHLLQKGFPAEKRPKWKAEVIEALFETLDSVLPNADVIWTERQMVRYRKQGSKSDWAVVVTKRRAGIDITITPDKEVGTGEIAGLASELEVLPEKHGKKPIRLRFLKLEQVISPRLKAFLKSTLES